MKNEEMSTVVVMNLAWSDYRLRWNPKEHEGITVMRIPAAKVWLPDIVLINNNDGVFDVALHVHVQVYHNGKVTWTPPALYLSSCSVKVEYFPFDWQNCSMVFRSYTYDASEIDIQYSLDSRDKEIQEIVLDEAFSGKLELLTGCPRGIESRTTNDPWATTTDLRSSPPPPHTPAKISLSIVTTITNPPMLPPCSRSQQVPGCPIQRHTLLVTPKQVNRQGRDTGSIKRQCAQTIWT
ncbi:acetylcholine receptor subunit beta-like [Periophthalmus magnuspinnatus]|uniref:acetylcholine receptor subunit beta-like n=1 Tax=Periophthalmus magnuspinnatus TaxID=409849 RepID=UPI002437190F|nr:acetylcholine receptor subunit beta-like [Periophthalmus magnuspinnatus]